MRANCNIVLENQNQMDPMRHLTDESYVRVAAESLLYPFEPIWKITVGLKESDRWQIATVQQKAELLRICWEWATARFEKAQTPPALTHKMNAGRIASSQPVSVGLLHLELPPHDPPHPSILDLVIFDDSLLFALTCNLIMPPKFFWREFVFRSLEGAWD